MENALIVSSTKEEETFFIEMLTAASIKHITSLESAGGARRLLLDQDFDLVIVDEPLPDESGEKLSRHIAASSLSQVIFVVKAEHFDAASAVCGCDGILTISKPVDAAVFRTALSFAKSTMNRINRIQVENAQLRRKIEDIRIIDRAKCLLISYLNLSEQESHRFIEKQAMDLRSSRRAVAEGILKTYAS